MLQTGTMRRIAAETLEYWRAEVKKEYFVETTRGKEVGHKLADLVDEKTTYSSQTGPGL